MKGLSHVPSVNELEAAYSALLRGVPLPSTADLARYSQWSRFDPRLAEIFVGYVGKHWKAINPVSFREAILEEPWPAAVAVLLEFVATAINTESRSVFRHWKGLLTEGLTPAGGEQFFIGLRRLGGEAMREDAVYPLKAFARWGFLARENLVPKRGEGAQAPDVRRLVLDALIREKKRLRVVDYWEALGKNISLRQAERDLMLHPLLKPRGRTKARYFLAK